MSSFTASSPSQTNKIYSPSTYTKARALKIYLPRDHSVVMDKYLEALSEYDGWEHDMTQVAKRKAREWFKDFTEDKIRFIEWKTNEWGINQFRYVLTKIQAILIHVDIIVDWDTTDDIQVDDENETMLIAGVFLLSKDECAASESESEDTDPCD